MTRDGTSKPVSRDQILRHARGQGNVHFPRSADHEQDWQPCPVDPYSAICDDHTYIHTIRLIYTPLYFTTTHTIRQPGKNKYDKVSNPFKAISYGRRIWIWNTIGSGAFRRSYKCGAEIQSAYFMGIR